MKKKSDADIQQAVLRELKWDTRVSETEVGVAVEHGVVTLSGSVNSWAKREAAEEAAHRVAGVLDVANDVDVVLPGSDRRTDTEIARAVRDTLEWDVLIPDDQIRTTVSNGRVTLEGEVSFYRHSENAEKAIRNLAGVTSVVNRIAIVPPPVTANDLRRSIEAALERRAERDAQRIDLRIEDGRVTLSGAVHSWQEREDIVSAVKSTSGVRAVNSQLSIEPYAT